MNQNTYASFMDFENTFDRVYHGKSIELLKSKDVDDIRIIINLYYDQKAEDKIWK